MAFPNDPLANQWGSDVDPPTFIPPSLMNGRVDTQLNALRNANWRSTSLGLQPVGNTDTPTTGTTPTLWLSLGSITAPTGMTAARVSLFINAVFEVAAGSDVCNIQIRIGTALGAQTPRIVGATSAVRFSFGYSDLLSSIPAGANTLAVYATRVSGTSAYRADTSSFISAAVDWLS